MYYFIIGSHEKSCFQNKNLEDSKYIGRGKSEDKFLAILNMFSVELFTKNTLKDEISKVFFDKYKENIIGDVYLIEDEEVQIELDSLRQVKEKITIKRKIIIENIETKEKIEAITYFSNIENLKEELEYSENIIKEYLKEEKISAFERIILIENIKNTDSKEELFNELEKIKKESSNE